MEIEHIVQDTKGVFRGIRDGEIAGEMTYTRVGKDKMIIDHTEVNPTFKGKGVGFKLVKHAVEFARENEVKIIPLCPFARSVFDRTEAFRDVLLY